VIEGTVQKLDLLRRMLAVFQQPIDWHCPAPQTDARPANSAEGTRFPFGPGVELNSCYVPQQRNNFLDLAQARRLLEHAHAFEPIQDGRIYIEKINGPFLYIDRGSPAEYSAGLKLAIERGWLEIHDTGTYVKFTAAGADLFA
jgi:hypothetical protein